MHINVEKLSHPDICITALHDSVCTSFIINRIKKICTERLQTPIKKKGLQKRLFTVCERMISPHRLCSTWARWQTALAGLSWQHSRLRVNVTCEWRTAECFSSPDIARVKPHVHTVIIQPAITMKYPNTPPFFCFLQ